MKNMALFGSFNQHMKCEYVMMSWRHNSVNMGAVGVMNQTSRKNSTLLFERSLGAGSQTVEKWSKVVRNVVFRVLTGRGQ